MAKTPKSIAIFGGSGTFAQAVSKRYLDVFPGATQDVFSRKSFYSNAYTPVTHHHLDNYDEANIKQACANIKPQRRFDVVLVATGLLHESGIQPEKSYNDITHDALLKLYEVNTIVPALIAKHTLPLLNQSHQSIFVALSARVGSISDNRLGGWYAYRSSKAALNMLIKTMALEAKRRHPQAIICGYHPGTVDSPLSRPFQRRIAQQQIFSPEYAAMRFLEVVHTLKESDSGKCLAWDRKEIAP